MKIVVNTLYWKNNNPEIKEKHAQVMNKFDIPVNYTIENIHHGMWIDNILNSIDSDVYVFFDGDCIPLNREAFDEAVNHAIKGYLVGNAHVTNCIKAKHDLFCGAAFLVINKDYYQKIKKPSAVNNQRSDIAQEFTRQAVDLELRLKMNFPTSFQDIPSGGIWRLSGYGYYGIGTIYDEKIYHLWQSRFAKNVELFKHTCDCVLNNDLPSIKRPYNCRNEYAGIFPIEDDHGY